MSAEEFYKQQELGWEGDADRSLLTFTGQDMISFSEAYHEARTKAEGVNAKEWLNEKGYYNNGLRTDRNFRIDLYLSDVLEEYRNDLLRIQDLNQ